MQSKEILLLAKSRKWGNYCMAGYDMQNGAWVRVISRNKAVHYSVPHRDIVLKGLFREAEVLDIVRINLQKVEPTPENPHQQENWIYDTNSIWEPVRTVSFSDIPSSIISKHNYLFFNPRHFLNKNEMSSLRTGLHSLELIRPDFFEFCIKEFEGQVKYYSNLKWNGITYKRIALTDPVYEQQALDLYKKYQKMFFFFSSTPLLVVSLSGVFEHDLCYYKLIASVLTDTNTRLCSKPKLLL